MAVATTTIADVSRVLATALEAVDDLRVYWYVADSARVPCAIIAQPSIDYEDPETPFCFGTYDYPIMLIVSRNSDQAAQVALSDLVSAAARALADANPDGVFSIEPTSARPTTATLNGQELAAYELRVRVRA